MKHRLLLLLVLSTLVLLGTGTGLARQADQSLTTAGLPEVVIEVSDDAVRIPGMVVSGRTLVTYRNSGSDSRHAFLARLPDELVIGDLFAPGGSEGPPDWLMQSTFPGFPGEVAPGSETHAIVDLTPGLYVVVEDNTAVMAVQPLGAESPSPVADPAAAATVSLYEFGFRIPAQLAAGAQVWKIVNEGAAPHELLITNVPDGTTVDDLAAALQNDGDLGTPIGGLGWLSPGMAAWTELDLPSGTYAALCFVFDPATGMPHAMEGMIQVFTIA